MFAEMLTTSSICPSRVTPIQNSLALLEPLEADGLVERLADGGLRVTADGQLLLRNVAMAFDAYLPEQRRSGGRLFSQTI